eukprot:GABV01001080.1.p1 GENE.GABV01001080.1~~GABV01001080.1.p1  ORF type:complete len:233 (-),score=60.17 GABV01001080.1:27-725(-)
MMLVFFMVGVMKLASYLDMGQAETKGAWEVWEVWLMWPLFVMALLAVAWTSAMKKISDDVAFRSGWAGFMIGAASVAFGFQNLTEALSVCDEAIKRIQTDDPERVLSCTDPQPNDWAVDWTAVFFPILVAGCLGLIVPFCCTCHHAFMLGIEQGQSVAVSLIVSTAFFIPVLVFEFSLRDKLKQNDLESGWLALFVPLWVQWVLFVLLSPLYVRKLRRKWPENNVSVDEGVE